MKQIKNIIIKNWITTTAGVLIILFALAAIWFGKVEFWNSLILIFAGCFFVVAKDTWIKNILSLILNKK